MGDLKSILVDKRAFISPRLEYRLRFSVAHEIGHLLKPYDFQRTPFEIDDRVFQLPKNPFRRKATPVILVPKNILSKLPVATDWDASKSALQAPWTSPRPYSENRNPSLPE
jgi:hypothetical protein